VYPRSDYSDARRTIRRSLSLITSSSGTLPEPPGVDPVFHLPSFGYQRFLQAAMLRFATTVTTQRVGEPDLSSLTERTSPVTVDPINVNVAFWHRYWA
jgi:hypothetical protein